MDPERLPTPEELYQKAERRIEKAQRTGATGLSLDFWIHPEPGDQNGLIEWEKPADFGLRRLPDSLWQLIQLERLDLANNQLTALPETLGQLTRLQMLDLNNNQLAALPETLVELTQLQMRLDCNSLPQELLEEYESGIENLKRYLLLPKEPLREAKLILVGEGAAGKSTLLDALRDEPWQNQREADRTETLGVTIKPVTLPSTGGEYDLHFNGWDFGGQERYLATHQLFFSAGAVYLALWFPESRTNDQWRPVAQWIQLVRNRVPDAQLLVVVTPERTRIPGTPLRCHPDEGRLREEFGDAIRGFYYIDCKPHEGVRPGLADLKRAIAEAAEQLPGMNKPVAQLWREAREALHKRGKAYLQILQALDVTETLGMRPAATRQFLQSADELGHLVYYPGDTDDDEDLGAQEVVILQPDRLAKAIGVVQTDSERLPQAKGLVAVGHIRELWQRGPAEAQLDRAFHAPFIALMNRYEVAYPVHRAGSAERLILLAQQVPHGEPADLPAIWPTQPDEPELMQECRVVSRATGRRTPPVALMYRLIVRFHRFSLGRDNVEDARHWQRGVVLADGDNGRALLTLDPDGTAVRIAVRAVHPQYLLWVLTREVVDVVESFWKSLRCDVYVPCLAPCAMGAKGPAWFSVSQLLRSKSRGIERVVCTHSSQLCECDFPVDGLLQHASTAGVALSMAEMLAYQQELRQQLTQLFTDVRAIKNRQEWMHADMRWGLRDLRGLLGDGFQRLDQQLQTTVIKISTEFQEQTDRVLRGFNESGAKAPRLFLLEPLDYEGLGQVRGLFKLKFRVSLVCEHSNRPLRYLNHPAGPLGVYEVELDQEWVKDAGELLQLMGSTLQLGAPVLTAALAFQSGGVELLKQEADFLKASGDAMEKLGASMSKEVVTRRELTTDANSVFLGGKRALERLQAEMERQDEEAGRPKFGGLKKMVFKTKGTYRWVHPQFADLPDYKY